MGTSGGRAGCHGGVAMGTGGVAAPAGGGVWRVGLKFWTQTPGGAWNEVKYCVMVQSAKCAINRKV